MTDKTKDFEKMQEEVEDDIDVVYAGVEQGVDTDYMEGELMTDCRKHYPGHRYLIMYHGTTMENALKIQHGGFKRSPDGMLGCGVYVSRDFRKAARYPINVYSQKAVLKVKVRLGKVKRIDYQGHPLQKTWQYCGYDTAWVPPNCGMVASGLEEDCVYDPWRIEVLEIIPH